MRTIGVYLYQNMTMLDVLGPQQFLGMVPEFEVVTVAKSTEPVVTDTKIRLLPDHDFTSCPPLDILLVGGAADTSAEMSDDDVMAWFKKVGESAEYVTSVCTGALILAEAGLLDGYQATTHWAYKEQLASYPEISVAAGRVVTDRNRITGGGVTAGIDFGLTLISQLVSPETAAALQLIGEYDPQPPTPCGSPETSPPELVAAVRAMAAEMAPAMGEFFAAKEQRTAR
jgi:transcriptional regulator GlxA family with amidase domain